MKSSNHCFPLLRKSTIRDALGAMRSIGGFLCPECVVADGVGVTFGGGKPMALEWWVFGGSFDIDGKLVVVGWRWGVVLLVDVADGIKTGVPVSFLGCFVGGASSRAL